MADQNRHKGRVQIGIGIVAGILLLQYPCIAFLHLRVQDMLTDYEPGDFQHLERIAPGASQRLEHTLADFDRYDSQRSAHYWLGQVLFHSFGVAAILFYVTSVGLKRLTPAKAAFLLCVIYRLLLAYDAITCLSPEARAEYTAGGLAGRAIGYLPGCVIDLGLLLQGLLGVRKRIQARVSRTGCGSAQEQAATPSNSSNLSKMKAMTGMQDVVLWLGIVLFVCMGVFPPWRYTYQGLLGGAEPNSPANQPDSSTRSKHSFDETLKQAEQGNADAQSMLAFMYKIGLGVKRDYKEAVKWYTKAAEQGNALAQFNLGCGYYKGLAVEQDHTQAIKWFTKAAEQGDAHAQMSLGGMYAEGQGVQQDYKQAVKWWIKVAEQGYARAKFNMGVMYYEGRGVEQDYDEAFKWWRNAAAQGDVRALFLLGAMLFDGHAVERDYKQAFKRYTDALPSLEEMAEMGKNPSRLPTLEEMRAQGDAGYRWFAEAANQGYASAQFRLGLMYAEGQGVQQDYKQAVKWFTKAAEQGQALAQLILGRMYWLGTGVAKDFVEAYKWFLLAGMNGEDVSEAKALLKKDMTPAQIATAQRKAKEYSELAR